MSVPLFYNEVFAENDDDQMRMVQERHVASQRIAGFALDWEML